MTISIKPNIKLICVELVVQFPARGSTQVLICLFLVCCGCETSYIVSVHIQCQASIYTISLCRGHAFMAGAASQAGDADSSRAPGLTSGLQGSVNVHRGALLLMPQCQCISSFVFYIFQNITQLMGSILSFEFKRYEY